MKENKPEAQKYEKCQFCIEDVQLILLSHENYEKHNKQKVFYKKSVLKISQYSQESTCVEVSSLMKM